MNTDGVITEGFTRADSLNPQTLRWSGPLLS